MVQPPGPAGPESAEPVPPSSLYPGQCYHAMVEGRTFLRAAGWPKVPQLKETFTRVSQMASVPIHGRDGPRLEFQVRKINKNDSQDLLTVDDSMWQAIKRVAFTYGATHQDDDKGYDPLQISYGNETSNIRVRWVVKDLTPPPSTPSPGSPGHEFGNVFWDCGKVREVTSSNVSPANDAEAAARISEYVRTNSPAPAWWAAAESALKPDPVMAYRAALRDARAKGLDTGPLRGPGGEEFVAYREARKTGGEVPEDQRPPPDEHKKKIREKRAGGEQ